jgi:hypothetical protein
MQGARATVRPRRPGAYFSQTFFMRTDEVGCSLKFMTFWVCGQITVEWAMEITATSS